MEQRWVARNTSHTEMWRSGGGVGARTVGRRVEDKVDEKRRRPRKREETLEGVVRRPAVHSECQWIICLPSFMPYNVFSNDSLILN